MKEIERKFLVKEMPDITGCECMYITQWYLTKRKDSIENRVRIYTDKNGLILRCYFDIKIGHGMIREEIGQQVDYNKFRHILDNYPSISKKRYRLIRDDHQIFLDIYNDGLMTCEIEVKEDKIGWLKKYKGEKWMGKDITGKSKYSNHKKANENFRLFNK